ncbi:MAG: putative Holliday junction resolvase [Planctomycetota bacterium]|jgi:putative Holliday junction resolvase
MGGVLAIDLGSKKTGFAYADPLRIIVRPLETLRVNEEDEALLAHVSELVNERDVASILVGIPLRDGNRPSARHSAVSRFVERLQERFGDLEIKTHDERLSTKEAEAQLYEAGYRGKDAARRKDSWAALVILRDFLAL